MSGPEHRHDEDRTGNGIVNHGPENTPNTDPEQDGEGTQDALDGAEAASGPTAPEAGSGARGPGADRPDGGDPGRPDPGSPERGAQGPDGRDSGARDSGARDSDTGASDVRDAHLRDSADGDAAVFGGGTLTELFGGGSGAGKGFGAPGGPSSPGGPEEPGDGDMDEVTLRRLLHGAVRDLEPSDGTLDHLQRAVPARRTRRRQGVVGAAAAALLIGTAVPAFVHVANSNGSVAANPAIAGHGEQAQGGSGEDVGGEEDGGKSAGPANSQSEGSEGEAGNSASPSRGSDPDAGTGGTTGRDDPPGSDTAVSKACSPDQLGIASAQAGAAGSDGTVYGTFRIANVSGNACSVTSNGTVSFQAAGAADPQKITVVQHTAGDPAGGLPDPSAEPGTVFLKPTMTYEVRFAWVPSATCPTTGGSPSPTPTDGVGSGSGGGSEGTGSEAGTTDVAAQFGSGDEGPADGSIAVTHTPEVGAPTAETTIANACAGTIYRTGVLNAS
ncbi:MULTISPECIES: hypothetical protein [Streptomyces]|uniref:DUF4232 domain-containing protein n=1 Tax=Streptomyces glycanivorans TaxID=3033808 RepID=A0ABY9JD61_9ACTN|nr:MULTISPECIES: hypothetical protein [unclassified Streptomyces]WSQ78982.1 hypothetical protein OG725_18585 [Streptomyces sp. NBC_01213]TXS17214.1 hypothetical protein EAO68_05130 [Streptomyces sp. wa22]WLQ65603.1 hypothetical protein P8A20_19290 [Streptomyces sp. Alt3]WSQ86351.1 hypothetical protein OG722_19195 [Streptomyces sp. NBC_01212]WSR49681.1 hypothetical protein OG279_19510 [Streptomyces sp. NBC_01201]